MNTTPNIISSNKYLTIKDAAKELNVHWQTIRNYIDRGELKANKVGKLIRIAREDLECFINHLEIIDQTIEVELRYKVSDTNLIQQNMLKLGGKLVQQSHIIDHWFIPIGIKNMSEEIIWFDKKRNTGIRVREYINEYGKQTNSMLETKRLTLSMNHDTFIETSLKVESYSKAKDFLEMLDRKEYLTIDKSRILYKLGSFSVCIDTIKDYGSGVEIEYIGNGKRTEILRKIQEFARSIGLHDKQRFEKSLTVDAMSVLAKF
ncbi:helix-turn-helix domain-containing protein [Patescibacteria group bacterium]|nr:helix-turn-helix domain-containing protein [Patescibacteria group bacterium]